MGGYATMNTVGPMGNHIVHENPFSVNMKEEGLFKYALHHQIKLFLTVILIVFK
jgi:hypothetical protein